MRHSITHTHMMKSPATRTFTLIELLLVVGLMLIIMTFSMPAFRRLVNGKAVDVSCRMITNQLRLARAAAISEQKYLALVMPGSEFESGSTSEEKPYRFRSFRVAVVEPEGHDNHFRFVRWYPGTEWTFLPVGAVIAEVNDSYLSGSTSAASSKEITGTDATREVNETWRGAKGLIEQSDDFGFVTKITDGSRKLVSGTNNNDYTNAYARAVVFDPKGRCSKNVGSQEVRYITLVEGNVDNTVATHVGSTDEMTLTEVDKLSMRIIKVSELTGRIEYMDTFR